MKKIIASIIAALAIATPLAAPAQAAPKFSTWILGQYDPNLTVSQLNKAETYSGFACAFKGASTVKITPELINDELYDNYKFRTNKAGAGYIAAYIKQC